MRGDRGFPDGRPRPRRGVLVVGHFRHANADDASRATRVGCDPFHRQRVNSLDGREVRPLLLIGDRYEVVVEKDGVPLLPWSVLERQGDQVSEATARHRVLVGKQPVIRVHAKLVSVGHRLGDEVATHLASRRRRDGGRKEKPDMRSVA